MLGTLHMLVWYVIGSFVLLDSTVYGCAAILRFFFGCGVKIYRKVARE